MTKCDSETIRIFNKILTEGCLDKDPRPKYKDGTPAHTLSYNHEMVTYDLAKGEFPLCTLRPIAIKSSIGEILWIYQDESNDLNLLRDKYKVNWWDEWDIGNKTIGQCYGATITFPSGVVLIKHWFIHNSIPKDRYTPTVYTDEKSMVKLKCGKPYLECGKNDNKSYTEVVHINIEETDTKLVTNCNQSENELIHRKDQISEEKLSTDKETTTTKFILPTSQQVSEYCLEKGYKNVDAERFVDFYESKGWMVGKNKMKDWKAAVRNWNRSQRQESTAKTSSKKPNQFNNFSQRSYDMSEMEKRLLANNQ